MHPNELNLRLQSPGKTVIGLFEAWKGFVAKLEVIKLYVNIILNLLTVAEIENRTQID